MLTLREFLREVNFVDLKLFCFIFYQNSWILKSTVIRENLVESRQETLVEI